MRGIEVLQQYRDVAPQGTVELLRQLGRRVEGKSMVHVNSTRYGGGVAEMLHRLLPLFEELGIKVRWEVMRGSDFFTGQPRPFTTPSKGPDNGSRRRCMTRSSSAIARMRSG